MKASWQKWQHVPADAELQLSKQRATFTWLKSGIFTPAWVCLGCSRKKKKRSWRKLLAHPFPMYRARYFTMSVFLWNSPVDACRMWCHCGTGLCIWGGKLHSRAGCGRRTTGVLEAVQHVCLGNCFYRASECELWLPKLIDSSSTSVDEHSWCFHRSWSMFGALHCAYQLERITRKHLFCPFNVWTWEYYGCEMNYSDVLKQE